MVVAAPPQLKVTVPPPVRAVVSAAWVQLPGVPVPTTPAAWSEAIHGRLPNIKKRPPMAHRKTLLPFW